jgi:membrane-associated phospholipid phosphatase
LAEFTSTDAWKNRQTSAKGKPAKDGLGLQDWQARLKPTKAISIEARVNAEIDALILAAETERADALGEILSQDSSFIGDFFGLMGGSPSTHPKTSAMMVSASMVAGMVVQHFKWLNNRRRPSQVCPALRPPIQVPGHAAYPSGHATQAFLIAHSLAAIFPKKSELGAGKAVQALAARIARNREIAGLHYASDTAAGIELAGAIWRTLKDGNEFKVLSANAMKEWEGVA